MSNDPWVGSTARVKGNSEYFAKKYGTPNPVIRIEDTDHAVLGRSWMAATGNPAALLYAVRTAKDNIPLLGRVYYGKIAGLGELVHESELEVATESNA